MSGCEDYPFGLHRAIDYHTLVKHLCKNDKSEKNRLKTLTSSTISGVLNPNGHFYCNWVAFTNFQLKYRPKSFSNVTLQLNPGCQNWGLLKVEGIKPLLKGQLEPLNLPRKSTINTYFTHTHTHTLCYKQKICLS